MVDELDVILLDGVLKVELYHFFVVGECVNRKFNALCDCYEVSLLWLSLLGLKTSDCFQVSVLSLI